MDEVARKYPKLLDTASLVLSNAQKHYFYDGDGKAHTVSATSGVDHQGDPLSAVLFMIGMISVMLAVKRTPDPHVVRFAAYIDDWLIVMRTAGIPGFMAVAEEGLAKDGLQLNKTKTHFWQPPADECVCKQPTRKRTPAMQQQVHALAPRRQTLVLPPQERVPIFQLT